MKIIPAQIAQQTPGTLRLTTTHDTFQRPDRALVAVWQWSQGEEWGDEGSLAEPLLQRLLGYGWTIQLAWSKRSPNSKTVIYTMYDMMPPPLPH